MSAQTRPKVVGIIQARMGSTRLPGKVLADIEGEPMLVRTFERSRRASSLDDLVIATTDENADAPVADMAAATLVARMSASMVELLRASISTMPMLP